MIKNKIISAFLPVLTISVLLNLSLAYFTYYLHGKAKQNEVRYTLCLNANQNLVDSIEKQGKKEEVADTTTTAYVSKITTLEADKQRLIRDLNNMRNRDCNGSGNQDEISLNTRLPDDLIRLLRADSD